MAIEFAAAMSEDDFTTGEMFHLETDKRRRLVMVAGLTKSSRQLRQIHEEGPTEYPKMLALGIEAYEHYENTLSLIASSLARLNAIAEERGNTPDKSLSRILTRATEDLKKLDS